MHALKESTENYLETILVLSHGGAPVRSIDVVNQLAFSRASVSIAMKKLRDGGFVHMDEEGHITLTPQGHAVAASMLERHTVIARFLEQLGVDATTATQDACRMEHVMSAESFAAIKRHAAGA